MANLKFTMNEGEPNTEDMAIISKGMLSHHASQGHPRKCKIFSILLKDKNNKLFGCVIVSFLWNGMEIKTLWIEETLRNQGWGKKLVEAVEKEAIKRECKVAYTNTFTWQAPEF